MRIYSEIYTYAAIGKAGEIGIVHIIHKVQVVFHFKPPPCN